MFFAFYFVVRSWRQYADTQCGIAKSLARISSRQFITKTRKTKYNHANAYGKEQNKHILQNDTAKAPDKRTNEETCKQTQCKTIQPRNPRKDAMRETNASKGTQTCWKMIPANASSSGKPRGRLRITMCTLESDPGKAGIRPRKQQENHCGNK